MSHNVTITRLPDETTDDYEYEFGGTHGSDCEVWVPCRRHRCQGLKRDYVWGDERTAHGVLHEYRGGEWFVESDICALRFVFESATDDEHFGGLDVGTYSVSIDWDGDAWLMQVHGSTVLYPDCQKWPHNPLDCRGDGPEDHDPTGSSDLSFRCPACGWSTSNREVEQHICTGSSVLGPQP